MPNNQILQGALSRSVLPDLLQAASKIASLKLTRPEFGSAKNISGIRSKTLTFSQRHDSRTVFASDSRYGQLGKAGVWAGSDRTPLLICRRVLRAAGVPAKEVAGIALVAEMGQVAERLSETEFRVQDPTVLRKIALARRAVGGVPVWSSYAKVGLNRKGELGWLELHWPELPAVVLKEADVLMRLTKRGFKAPDVPGARVEMVEAGILHSPAIGFFMDITPSIRVIYKGEDSSIGRKPVLYLDRHGEPVVLPRDIEPAKPAPGERPKSRQE